MKKRIIIILILIAILVGIVLSYVFNIISHKEYSNSDFNIETYISEIDKDNDGIDDQTDILNSAKKYIETKPKYQSKYYETGYPNDEYGVCTDVIHHANPMQQKYEEDVLELYDKDYIVGHYRIS